MVPWKITETSVCMKRSNDCSSPRELPSTYHPCRLLEVRGSRVILHQPTFISHLLIGLAPCTFLEDGRLLSEKVKFNDSDRKCRVRRHILPIGHGCLSGVSGTSFSDGFSPCIRKSPIARKFLCSLALLRQGSKFHIPVLINSDPSVLSLCLIP